MPTLIMKHGDAPAKDEGGAFPCAALQIVSFAVVGGHEARCYEYAGMNKCLQIVGGVTPAVR
jgi:hypothetical protein